MQIRIKFFFVSLFILTNVLHAQFNENEFLYRAKTIYHSLRLEGLDNFSSWISSNVFIEQTKEFYPEETSPLEIIWKNPNKIFYIKRPLPDQKDEEINNTGQQFQMDMLQELKGLLIDWQRFNAGNILDDVPEAY